VRFLSAGCSTGEEPFSIVISLVEKYGTSILDRIEVFGVDIDNNVINAARAGIYKSHSFRGTNSQIREKYFTPKADAGQGSYEVSGLLKKVVEFQALNLFDNGNPPIISSVQK
jgi:chemotaxis protein methyltransferase CheR